MNENHAIPPPTLPADAPFNDKQKMWLKGFFDGLSAIANDEEEKDEQPI
jgi:hypothetical protein